MKSLDEQIAALENRLLQMKSKKKEEMAKTYANLIGTCMKMNSGTYHMITEVLEVNDLTFDEPDIKDDKEIRYYCIQICWHPREKPNWRTAEIHFNQIGRVDASNIPRLKISFEKFLNVLCNCSDFIQSMANMTNQKKMESSTNKLG